MSRNNGEGDDWTIPAARPTDSPPRRRRRGFGLGLVVGVFVGLLGWGAWTIATRHLDFPRLSHERLVAAQEMWQKNRPAEYDLTVVVTGDLAGTYRLQVRGETVEGTLNEQPVGNRGEGLRYWTIDGMFDVMEVDLERCEKAATPGAQPGEARLVLSADFDPRLGYPRRYRRLSLEPRRAVEWEITQFSER
jgi:hypothetical protein